MERQLVLGLYQRIYPGNRFAQAKKENSEQEVFCIRITQCASVINNRKCTLS
jgi:hypothetical protein